MNKRKGDESKSREEKKKRKVNEFHGEASNEIEINLLFIYFISSSVIFIPLFSSYFFQPHIE